MEKELKIAILIDAENISSKYASIILQEAAGLGNVIYKRIYGDWTTPALSSWKKVLLENAIQPVQQFCNTYGKNSSDSALIIDAMDLLYQHKLDAFCIVSSDSDFTRLASRLRESQMFVLGMGEKKTPRAFISACNKFSYLDLLYQAAQKQNSKRNRSSQKAKVSNKQTAPTESKNDAAKNDNTKAEASKAEASKADTAAIAKSNAHGTALAKSSKQNGRHNDDQKQHEVSDSAAIPNANAETASLSNTSAEPKASDEVKNNDGAKQIDDSKIDEVYGEGSDITVVTNTLCEVTEEFSGDDGWIISSSLGAHLSKRLPDFDTRNFGFRKFVPFVSSLGIFESKSVPSDKDENVKMVYFRLIEE